MMGSRRHIRRVLPGIALLDAGFGPIELPILDVSRDGMFLRSELLLEEGERFSVRFTLPGSTVEVRGWGEIVRVQALRRIGVESGQAPGMGLRFLALDRRAAAELDRYLSAVA